MKYIEHEKSVFRDDGVWIPKSDENRDYVEFLAWVAAGNVPGVPVPLGLQQRAQLLLGAVDAHLNAAARAKGYDSIITAALRAALPESPFHAEGLAFGNWMDQVYATCYEKLAAVQAGGLEEPTEAELIAMLPLLVLPT